MGNSFIVRKGGGGIDGQFSNIPTNVSNISYVAVSAEALGVSNATLKTGVIDDNFVYTISSGNTNANFNPFIGKWSKNLETNFSIVASVKKACDITIFDSDSEFLYVVERSGTTRSIVKRFKSNLAQNAIIVYNTTDPGIFYVDPFDSFFYLGAVFTGGNLQKRRTSDLGVAGTINRIPRGIATDNTFLYMPDPDNGLYKYRKSNLQQVASLSNFGQGNLFIDNQFLYHRTGTNLRKFHTGNLVLADSAVSGVSSVLAGQDENFLYAEGGNVISKYSKETLLFVGQSNTGVTRIAGVDNTFVYTLMTTQRSVKKFRKEAPAQNRIIVNNDIYIKQ
jgi:hypothetical protein